jgi:hypothetical protein
MAMREKSKLGWGVFAAMLLGCGGLVTPQSDGGNTSEGGIVGRPDANIESGPPGPEDSGFDGGTRWCGARAGNTCTSAEYCAYREGEFCGAADAEAICQPRPVVCNQDYRPVCGCDRRTYGNACTAAMAGTGILRAGICEDSGPI